MNDLEKNVVKDLKALADKFHPEWSPLKSPLKKAAKRFPRNLWILNCLAVCTYEDKAFSEKDRLVQALEILDKAAEVEPGDINDAARLFRGFAYNFFKLGEFSYAGPWLVRLKKFMDSDERKKFCHNLIDAGMSHEIPLPDISKDKAGWRTPWQVLADFMGDETDLAIFEFIGKTGLALSGGGFRASLYHLGVLARLAEMDALRNVEVLSTVSGGSIVGAHYYLEVKHLLETKSDDEITAQDYIDIVSRVQKEFLAGVQKNIRFSALNHFKTNLWMIFSRKYSRSNRIGELYEEIFYSRVRDRHEKNTPRCMNDLIIHPKDEHLNFSPRACNWRRKAKVPVLLINATSLNTGHNWQFTARSMGEPPAMTGGEVDKNARYRRFRYDESPTEELKHYRLGYAVAASACVPGLFDALPLTGLYENKTVRLVDGGVHDNQGVAGLLDEGCSFVLCSDASGQMDDVDKPSDGIVSTLLRSKDIITDRVREEEYDELLSRKKAGTLRGLFFVHLKKDLEAAPLDWINCSLPSPPKSPDKNLPYGISAKFQEKIAKIRTDLDTFTDTEAFALMASGYLMSEQKAYDLQKNGVQAGWQNFQVDAPREDWPFLALKDELKYQENPSDAQKKLDKQLTVGASALFKVWKLDPQLRQKASLIIGAAFALSALMLALSWNSALCMSVGGLMIALLVFVTPLLFPAVKWLFPQNAARGFAYKILVAIFGSSIAQIHLKIFDPKFIALGKIERLFEKE